MAKEEKEEGAVAEIQPEKKKRSIVKIIIIAALLLILVAGGVFGAIYMFHSPGVEKKPATPQPPPAIGILWPMEPFIVNLLDNQGERYLKIIIQLEMSNQAVVQELDQLKPKIRDNMLDLLTAKTFNEMMDMGGKQKLREEIVARLNIYLTKGKIAKVYFTDFVIQ